MLKRLEGRAPGARPSALHAPSLKPRLDAVNCRPMMKLFLAILIYVVLGVILGAGIILALKGSWWFLIVAFLAYTILFSKIGCLTH
jgi:hypothetical protein